MSELAQYQVTILSRELGHDVLIVDNDAITLMLAGRQMRNSRFTLKTCETASEAIEYLEKAQVRLLLVDLHMDPMNGLELLEILCAQSRLNATLTYLSTSAVPDSDTMQRLDKLGIQLLLKADMLNVDSIENLLNSTP